GVLPATKLAASPVVGNRRVCSASNCNVSICTDVSFAVERDITSNTSLLRRSRVEVSLPLRTNSSVSRRVVMHSRVRAHISSRRCYVLPLTERRSRKMTLSCHRPRRGNIARGRRRRALNCRRFVTHRRCYFIRIFPFSFAPRCKSEREAPYTY